MPIVVMSAHILHLIEHSEFPISDYPRKILSSIYSVLTLQNLRSWPGRVYSLISYIFLFFLIVFIISDLAGSMTSISVSSGDLEDKDVCMSQTSEDVWGYLYVRRYNDRTEECLDNVVNGDYEMGIVGKLELAHSLYINEKSRYKNYLIYSETPHETQFSLVFSTSASQEYNIHQINLHIRTLWDSGYILSSIENYTTYIDIPSAYTSSFIFNSTRIILVGTTLLVFFILAILFSTAVLVLYKSNSRKSNRDRDLALSARALLRSRNQTLSLERSNHLDQQGHGRPEPEWVHKAVAVDDEHAQRIKNIQDYENELSAVAPVFPSFVSSESLLSILKLENKN